MKTKITERHKRRLIYEKRIIICIVIGFCILAALLISGLFSSKPEKIKGTWAYDSYTRYEFDGKKDGCMYLGELDFEYKYTVKGNKITMDFIDEDIQDCVYTFKLDEDKLIITGGKGTAGGTFELKRK